jgi:hypothetical protein
MVTFQSITDALKDFKKGKPLIVVDDPGRENEGDVVIAAEKATPEAINFMAKEARGLICVPMLGERLDKLKVLPMVERGEPREAAFTISVDAKQGSDHGDFGSRPGANRAGVGGSPHASGGSSTTGTYFSASLQRGGGFGPVRSYGGRGGFGPIGGIVPGGGDL